MHAILVDDEKDSRETLATYLERYCPDVTVDVVCEDIIEAKKAILKYQPDLVFLDIEMPHGNAFDLLEQFGKIPFEVIFVTAYSQYAVQAFNLSAANYLLKPIDIEELEKAVAHVAERIEKKEKLSHANILLENLNGLQNQNRKLVLPLLEGFEVVRMSEVIYCEAADNFTCFFLKDGTRKMICRSLKFYEKALSSFGFYRIHRSHLINLEYLKRYLKGKGGTVVLEDGKELMVANNRKEGLLKKMRGEQ